MPVETWLAGDFRATWGPEPGEASAPRTRRSAEDVSVLAEEFLRRLESLLGRRPEWDRDGPARSATAFSAHAFSLPFLQARRWAYRMKLPQLAALETPQIWIPAEFDAVFRLDSLFGDGELRVGSLPRVRSELERLLGELSREDEEGDWAELRDVAKVASSLRHVAEAAIESRMPAIVEG